MRQKLTIWTIYDKPLDYLHGFIARRFTITHGRTIPTEGIMICETLEPIQEELENNGFVKIARDPEDEPSIVESWI